MAFTLCPAGHAGSNLRRTREYARWLCVCVKSERDREAHTREEEGPGENARDAAAEERRGRARRRWCRGPLSASGPGGARLRLEGLERLLRTQGLAGELTVRQQSRRAPGGRASCERRE